MPDLSDIHNWGFEKIILLGLCAAVFFLGKHILGKLSDCESDRADLWAEIASIKDRIISELQGKEE